MVDHNVVGSMKYVSKWRHLYIMPESRLKYDSMKKNHKSGHVHELKY